MALHGEVKINGRLLLQWSAVRKTGTTDPDSVNNYHCDVVTGPGHSQFPRSAIQGRAPLRQWRGGTGGSGSDALGRGSGQRWLSPWWFGRAAGAQRHCHRTTQRCGTTSWSPMVRSGVESVRYHYPDTDELERWLSGARDC